MIERILTVLAQTLAMILFIVIAWPVLFIFANDGVRP